MLIREAIEFNPEEKQSVYLHLYYENFTVQRDLLGESLIVDPATAVSISIIYVSINEKFA